ncbi:MAG: hypothetical protein HC802_18570 [Caldilineaceae bacterium]|nr:hypothetical protein [Caldilineaceae bacterium]
MVVVDDDGNQSTPVNAKVVVIDPGPRAVIKADERVAFGKPFRLSGEESTDIGAGKIVKYVWTLVEQG